jgi:RNA polymerase sigma factor (sigma-70 family)
MEQKHIHSLIHSHPKAIEELYNSHRAAFIGFGKKYGLNNAELADIYQDAFIALRKHAINGTLDTVKSSLRTYLFGIGKYMIFNVLKEKDKTTLYNTTDFKAEQDIELIKYEINTKTLTKEEQLLHKNFKALGNKCQEVLTLFYYRGLSIKDIVDFTNYANERVVRSQKSRCLKTLKELIKQN